MTDTIFAQKKQTREYMEDGDKYKLSFTAKLYSIGNQFPYFSITGEKYQQAKGDHRWMEDSFGCLHDDIEKYFPKMSKFIKWHLVIVDQPLHYVENSLYWAGLQGWTDGKKDSPPKYDYLVSTCKWGEVESDKNINLKLYMGRGNKNNIVNRIKSYLLRKILVKRAKAVQKEFYSAMTELFGIDWIEPVEKFLEKNK